MTRAANQTIGSCVRAVLALAVALVCAVESAAESDVLRSGLHCATRRDGCCTGRQDDCTAPIRDTLCYCDEFCAQTPSKDCCPDYQTHCLGVDWPKPPPSPPEVKRKCFFFLDSKWTEKSNLLYNDVCFYFFTSSVCTRFLYWNEYFNIEQIFVRWTQKKIF